MVFDVVVIGEGIAGLTAAGEAASAGLRVASLEAQFPGGLVANIVELDPPPDDIPASGADLAGDLALENLRAGVRSINTTALGLQFRPAGRIDVMTPQGPVETRAVIVASGARMRALGIPGEKEYAGRGLSTCADCDGPLFRDEVVVVVGGGDSALQEARVLAAMCAEVIIIHDRARLSAHDRLVERALCLPNVRCLPRTTVVGIEGQAGVEAVIVRSEGSEGVTSIPCKGVFAFVGLTPSTEFVSADVALDSQGAIRTSATRESSVQNVWAIGAVRSEFRGLLSDAISDAVVAVNAVTTRLRSGPHARAPEEPSPR